MKKKYTLFGNAKNKYLADIISFESIPQAEKSVRDLKHEFHSAKTGVKKLRILRSVDLAWKRAEASLNKASLKPDTRDRYVELRHMYKGLYNELRQKYNNQ